METNLSSWNTHFLIGRRLVLAPGQPLIEHVCIDMASNTGAECSMRRFSVARKDSPTTAYSDDWLPERSGFEPPVSREVFPKETSAIL
jgi:hypothetical protein